MNSQPTASVSSLPQVIAHGTEVSSRAISPGLASGTVSVAGDILDCSAETHRIEPQQVEAEMERIRRAFAQVEAELEETARRLSEQISQAWARYFVPTG